jgi:hypothetical protein
MKAKTFTAETQRALRKLEQRKAETQRALRTA